MKHSTPDSGAHSVLQNPPPFWSAHRMGGGDVVGLRWRGWLQAAAETATSDQVSVTDRPPAGSSYSSSSSCTTTSRGAKTPKGDSRLSRLLAAAAEAVLLLLLHSLQQSAGIAAAPPLRPPPLALQHAAQKSVFCNRPTDGVLQPLSSSSAVCAHRTVYLSVCNAAVFRRGCVCLSLSHTDHQLVNSTVQSVQGT